MRGSYKHGRPDELLIPVFARPLKCSEPCHAAKPKSLLDNCCSEYELFLLLLQGWNEITNGTALYDMLQQSFAWAVTSGIRTNQSAAPAKFPVIVGELGASLGSAQVMRCRLSLLQVFHVSAQETVKISCLDASCQAHVPASACLAHAVRDFQRRSVCTFCRAAIPDLRMVGM